MPPANDRSATGVRPYPRPMALRRAFFVWQYAAAAVLPLWLLLGYAVWGASSAGGLVGVVLLAPVVLLVELGLALLFSARRTVRRSRALDAPAVGVLALFQLGVVGLGFFGATAPWFALVAAAAAIGGSWLGGRLLVRDVRRRVDALRAPSSASSRPLDAGEYVVVKPGSR